MNKEGQLEQLSQLLMSREIKSGLYLIDTDLTDEEIGWHVKQMGDFSFYRGTLMSSKDCTVFELFVIMLSLECETGEIKDLRNSFMSVPTKMRDTILLSLLALIMRKLSAEKKAIIHVCGDFDLSALTHDDLNRLQDAISNNDNPIVILNKKKDLNSLIKTVSLKDKIRKTIMNDRKAILHISYKHDPAYEEVMRSILAGLDMNGIPYSIDEYDILYRDSIDDYEKEIGASDRVVMFVIPSYLKSLDCMYEMTQMFNNGNVRERIFPVVDMGGIPRNSYGLSQIKEYWKGEKERRSEMIKTELGGSSFVLDEINKIDEIIVSLNDFWFFISRESTGNYEKLIENNAALLMEELKKAIPREETKYDKNFIPSGDTSPSETRIITQNGDKSVIIENNPGTIIIN